MSSYSSLLSSDSFGEEQSDDKLMFEIGDYLVFNEELQGGHTLPPPPPPPPPPAACQQSSARLQTSGDHASRSSSTGGCTNTRNLVMKTLRGTKIAFRTKSEHEILDDGYKWRKYGKKMVKNNPNPRNYYRCLTEGCNVKKRAEREREDSSYVITSYEGVHNHQAPFPATAYHHTHDSPSFHDSSS